ncbi:MAG: ester cyclase [Deltaproteobacteria bacterium]|nr:ester cyclase [Deltaproteobacteria bacterium]
MQISPRDMDQKLDEHFHFERTDNVEGVLSTLAPDAVHDIVGWPSGPTLGRENARPFYETLFADLAEGEVTSVSRYYGERLLIDESLWKGRASGRPFGLEGRNRPLEFRLLHLIEFNDEGQIKKEQVWIDLAAIIQQLPQD